MTPQERDLLTNLVTRLRQAPQQQRDSEAASMIDDLVRERPDVPYALAQTVIIQDYSLHQAQARIAELEQQLQPQQGHQEGGFLSAIFGSSKPQGAPPPRPQAQPYQQPSYAQPAAGPWGQAPTQGPAQQVFAQPGSQPSFLRSAATTAAGVAGGALLFEGIESLFGGGRGGFGGYGGAGYGGFMPQPGITETVVNNYYDDPSHGTQSADFQQTDFGANQGDGGLTDASYDDPGSDFDDGGGFDGGDSSGSDV